MELFSIRIRRTFQLVSTVYMLLTTRTRAYPFSKDVWGLYGICKRKAVINVAKIKKEIIVEDVLVFLVRTS